MNGLPRLALLLAGGRSRRLGRDKALLDDGGRSLVRTRIEALRREFDHCVVALDRRRAACIDAVTIWPDREPGAGPMPALADALDRWGDALYLCAVDMPHAGAAPLAMLAAARHRDPDASAWLVEHEGMLQPIGAIYAAKLAPELRDAIEGGERSLQRFLRSRADLCRVEGPEPLNLNRPTDAARWRGEADHV